MTTTARHLIRRAYSALKSGDLTNRDSLKDAMVWLNFQNSAPNRPIIADCFYRLDPNSFTELPSNPVRPKEKTDYCQGKCSTKVAQFHWVDIVTKHTSATLPRDASPRNQAIFRSGLIRAAEDRINSKKAPILWLSELDKDHLQDIQPNELLGDLGRYSAVLKQDDRIAIYTVEVSNVYKPTMIDAGFTFFWLAWRDDDSCGMTLGLNDGQPTYKEWVVSKDTVKIVDAWFLTPAEGLFGDDQIPLAYWDSCRQRVVDQRGN